MCTPAVAERFQCDETRRARHRSAALSHLMTSPISSRPTTLSKTACTLHVCRTRAARVCCMYAPRSVAPWIAAGPSEDDSKSALGSASLGRSRAKTGAWACGLSRGQKSPSRGDFTTCAARSLATGYILDLPAWERRQKKRTSAFARQRGAAGIPH